MTEHEVYRRWGYSIGTKWISGGVTFWDCSGYDHRKWNGCGSATSFANPVTLARNEDARDDRAGPPPVFLLA